MTENWETYKLKDICEKVSVGFVGTISQHYTSKNIGIPILRSKNVRPGKIDFKDLEYVTRGFHAKNKKSHLKKGDIVIVRVGQNRGDVCKIPDGFNELNVANCVFLSPPNNYSNYIELFLRSPYGRNLLLSISTGSAQGVLNTSAIAELSVPLPEKKEAILISSILNTLDDKIELNLQMNKTLEEMAMALYKHWFVDFGPFQNGEFVDSELGKIPKGWEVKKIIDHYNAERGFSYKGKYLSKETSDTPMHNLNSIYEGGFYKYKGIKYYTGEFKEKHKAISGDLIVANTEQGFNYLLIGSPAMIPKSFQAKGIFSHHLYRVRPKENSYLSNIYFYMCLLNKRYRQRIIGYSNGTTVNMLPKTGLERPPLLVPPKKVIEDFDKKIQPLLDQKEHIYIENQTLTKTRDTLLPQLISGKVRVKLPEKTQEGIT